MRRLFSAAISALLVAALLPLQVLAAGPAASASPVTTDEDTPATVTLVSVDDDGDATTLFEVVTGPALGTLGAVGEITCDGQVPNACSAQVMFTPILNANGPDSFTFTATAGGEASPQATANLVITPVNDPPVGGDDPGAACGSFGAFDGSFPIPEDYAFGPQPGGTACALDANDTDVENDPLTFALVTPAAHGIATVAPDGGWSYTPSPDFFTPILDYLSDSFTYRAWDGTDWSAPATMRLWIAPVNDAPSFAAGADVTVDEDSGAYGAGWATSISAGPGETGQAVTFVVDGYTSPSLFATPPAISPAGVLTFVPAAQWSGSSTVTVHAHDDGGLEDYGVAGVTPADTSASQAFTITVSPVNDAPTPDPTAAILAEDAGPSLIPVSATDAEGDATTAFNVATPAAHGLVVASPGITCSPPGTCAGAFNYTPDADYNGPDSFTFTATDGGTPSAPATVSITVTAVNDEPVCTGPYPGSTAEDTQGTGSVSCTDIDSPSLTYGLVDAAGHGTADVAADGTWTYEPVPDYNGTDSFTFTATDGLLASAPATVTITITAVNDRPVCTGPYASSGAEDASWGGSLACTDVEGTTLTYAATSDAGHGSRSVAPDGTWTYAPALDYAGADSFAFAATDGLLTSDAATMSITVTAVNDKPVCTGLTLSTDRNVAVGGTVACTDAEGSGLTLRVSTDAATGTVAPFDTSTGAFTYTPDIDATGVDSFAVTANDGVLDSDPVTVEIGIANHAPVCTGASPAAADEDTAQTGTLSCTDDDGDTLSYATASDPANGSVVVDPGTGAWTYTPGADYHGGDSFTATASDGAATSAPATITLVVDAVNDLPVCDPVFSTGDEEVAQGGTVACTDVEGDPLTYAKVTDPAKGAATVAANGDWTFLPTVNRNGADSFTFTANDGTGDSAPQTVSLTVVDVNDAPDARNDQFTVNATSVATLDVLGTGANVLGRDFSGPAVSGVTTEPTDTVTVTAVTQGTKGSVAIAPGGTGVVYDVSGCAYGGDSFSYTVTDGQGQTDTATAFVTIARPGENGLSSYPITDAPGLTLISNSTIASTVPARLTWCGVTRSGYGVRSYSVLSSANGGAYSGTVVSGSTATSSVRNLTVSTTYRWRARTTDNAGRTGSWGYSLTARIGRYQENHAAFRYTGAWKTSVTASASGSAQRYAYGAGSSASIVLTNVRQFGIVGPRSSGRGSFEVWVDGVRVATISEKATTTVYRRVLYVRNVTSGVSVSHTVEIRAVGNGRIDLDAIVALS